MQKIILIFFGVIILFAAIIIFYFIGKYNSFVTAEQAVKSQWAQVESQYQRRFDLIGNLVETVKGYAKHEKETLQNIVEARSKVGQPTLSAEALKNPEQFSKFAEGQAGLSSALSRLFVVVEKYPDLKANENFVMLQSQLEGTENRIAVKRMRYNESVQKYNAMIKYFPGSFIANMFNFKDYQYFKAEESAQKAPQVKF